MARKKIEEESRGAPEWMTTYSDLVTLLLTFFILLFSLSAIDAAKFEAITSSLRSSFNVLNRSGMLNSNTGDAVVAITNQTNAQEEAEEPPVEPGSKEHIEQLEGTISELRQEVEVLSVELAEYQELDAEAEASALANANAPDDARDTTPYEMTEEEIIQKEIRDARQQKLNNFKQDILEEVDLLGIGGYVSIVSEEERLVLRLNSQILFDSGSATLRQEGRDVMLSLGESFQDLDHFIDVQGHTDNVPIRTSQFPSNWELSTQRATNVVRILQDECQVPPSRLRSTGFGEYQEISDNATPEGRQNNRRIDIVITTN
ncbi:MAG: flagellar motor protein MotB [Oscillospiraceae bacterium]|nr:flagellar motor protein MotB [Oscillospiraceae bacterium]